MTCQRFMPETRSYGHSDTDYAELPPEFWTTD
jgi:hypothetical protein